MKFALRDYMIGCLHPQLLRLLSFSLCEQTAHHVTQAAKILTSLIQSTADTWAHSKKQLRKSDKENKAAEVNYRSIHHC